MRYVIADANDDSMEVDGITTDPKSYAMSFEPIDVINGKMVAWDENGVLYHFISEKPLAEATNNGFFTTVDVGSWTGEDPQLKMIEKDDTKNMRFAIVAYLQNLNQPKKHRWSNSQPAKETVGYDDCSLEELLEKIEVI